MQTQVHQQEDHRSVKQAIDTAYLATIESSASLRLYLMRPRGPYQPIFLDFYQAFYCLFNLTAHRPHVAGKERNEQLIKDIDDWLDNDQMSDDHDHGINGVKLFKQWREALDDAGVISA